MRFIDDHLLVLPLGESIRINHLLFRGMPLLKLHMRTRNLYAVDRSAATLTAQQKNSKRKSNTHWQFLSQMSVCV